MMTDIDSKINDALTYMYKDTKKALKIFDEILEVENDNIRAVNGRATMLSKLKRFDEAEECFRKSLDMQKSTSALINLGLISKRRSSYKESLNYFDKAMKLEPKLKNIIAGFMKDVLMEYRGDDYEFLLSDLSSKANGYIASGLRYERVDNYWDAIECYEMAIDADSSTDNFVNPLMEKIKIELLDEFLYENLSSENIGNNPLRQKVARAMIIEHRPKKITRLLNELLTENPLDIAMLNFKGIAEFSFDNYEESITYFDKCIDLNQEYHYAIFNRGLVLRRLRRYEESLACFESLSLMVEYYDIIRSHQSSLKEKIVTKSSFE